MALEDLFVGTGDPLPAARIPQRGIAEDVGQPLLHHTDRVLSTGSQQPLPVLDPDQLLVVVADLVEQTSTHEQVGRVQVGDPVGHQFAVGDQRPDQRPLRCPAVPGVQDDPGRDDAERLVGLESRDLGGHLRRRPVVVVVE